TEALGDDERAPLLGAEGSVGGGHVHGTDCCRPGSSRPARSPARSAAGEGQPCSTTTAITVGGEDPHRVV
ncbi:MAG: hypothetical protein M3Y36_11215, partial [Actinomycetota bacterium]|nr:hypothetical protein [Actinomycetota bacterium]